MKKKNLSFQVLLLVSTALAGCGSNTSIDEKQLIPGNYEFTPNIHNVRGGAYYEIFVRTFADTNGDRVGDLNGITEKLPYLKELGVGGIWLMPIHPSPSYHGYDVEDYKSINKEYGTLDDFDKLISSANNQNIDVIIDLVINHTSKTHPWFIEGYNNFKSGNFSVDDVNNKANWYNFQNVNGVLTYEAGFGEWMPDLNLDNPAVRDEIESITKFWLDRGVKGFRLDAVTYYYKDDDASIDFLTWFKSTVKKYNNDAFIVGEAWTDENSISNFYQGNDSYFNFKGADVGGYIIDNIQRGWGDMFAARLTTTYEKAYLNNEDARVATFLTNHDMDRSSQMYLNMYTEQRSKLAASVYLLTPGIPFIYYGEEIGLKGVRAKNENTDANRRLAMVWQKSNDTWRTKDPIGSTFPASEQVEEGALDLLQQPFSLVNHYKKVLNIRNQYPWLLDARVESLDLGVRAIAALNYVAKNASDEIYVLHNFAPNDIEIDLSAINNDEIVSLLIAHDIFTSQKRTEFTTNKTILLPSFSSVVIEEE